MTGDVGSQRPTAGRGACQDEEVLGVEVGLSVGGQEPATVADAAAVAALDQVGSNVMAKVEESMKKLMTENLSLYGELVEEKSAYARALLNNIRLQQHRKKAVEEKKEVAWLSAAGIAKRENSVVVEQLKKEFSAITMEAHKQIGALVASLERAGKEIENLKQEREAAI